MRVTSLEISHHGLVLDTDVPHASGKYPLHIPVTENTSSLCVPTGMLTACRREDSFSGRIVLASWERNRPAR